MITNQIFASGGDEMIIYRWKMDNQVISGKEPDIKIYTNTLAFGSYLFTREARDGACAGGWIASDGYYKVIIPQPRFCDLKPNNIVAKTDPNGTPYILLYPNPDRILQYQWYKDDKPIANADEQFYYPPNGTLQMNANYKVEIWESHDIACKKYSNSYIFSGNANLSASGFTVTPNPINNSNFTVSFNREMLQNDNGTYILTIYSALGEKIWELKMNNLNDINIAKSLRQGIFFVTLTTDNKLFTEKIIVQ
jgi:hypothetical protein